MPRGRPRKKPPDPEPIDAIDGEAITPDASPSTIILPHLPGLPPQKVKGEWNPEYFAARLDRAINTYEKKVLEDGESSNFNADQYTKMVMNQAKLVGVTERDVIDRRTEAQRAEDLWAKIAGDAESIFGASDEDLKALDAVIAMKETRMDSAEEQCLGVLEGKLREADDARDDRSARGPKAWRRRIQRILRLRERARLALPMHNGKGSWAGNQYTEERDPGLRRAAIEAAHVLRFMVYVGRVGMDTTAIGQEQTPADMIYDVGPHHAKFAATLWCHRNGVGPVFDDSPLMRKHVLKRHVVPYVGSIQIMPLAHGKPLDIETLVTMGDGTKKRLGDIVVGDRVIGHSGFSCEVTAVHEQGELDVLKISTASHREVVPATSHPFLTTLGWKRADELVVGNHLAIRARMQFDTKASSAVDHDAARLAGYFIGDGHVANVGPTIAANITCADDVQGEEILRCAKSMGFEVTKVPDPRSKAVRYAFKSGSAKPREWLRETGMGGHKSGTKRVPRFILTGSDRCVAEFVAGYFECDGTVSKKMRGREDLAVEFYSISRGLLEDVSFLLLRFGIKARISTKMSTFNGKPHTSYRMAITSGDETAKFANAIPVFGSKGVRLERFKNNRSTFDAPYLSDKIESIVLDGKRQCRCLTVKADSTFLANDFVVHNTDLAINYSALEMGLNPRITGLYLHAKGDVAIQNLATVKRYLDPNTGMGQRYLSLFPCKLAKTQNDSGRIRLVVRNPPKSPTFTAAGVDSARLGIDADLQVWDDVVPQSDAEQPTERERRGRILRGTFSSRKRSRKAFTLVIGTLWHHADALAQLIGDAKLYHEHDGRQGSCYGINIQRVGGPKATEKTNEWEVLWPGQYDQKRLREKYAELRPALYSAAMMANPLAEEQRIVKKLRLYDPATDEHQAFIRNSVKYISLDPSATKNSTSDKAGIVYAGFGDVRTSRTDEAGMIFSDTEKRVRFFDHREIHATQYDLVEYTETFALKNVVDYVLVEAVSGFAGIVEMFQNRGIDVIRKDPKGKNKEQRLRGVAPILDDSGADLGMRATAEFPGVYNEKGEFVLDPRFKELAEQILDFGVCANDHSLDAAVYLLGELAPDLGVGRGMITRQVRVVQKEMGDPRLLEMYKSYERANKLKQHTSEEQEHEWMKRAWS